MKKSHKKIFSEKENNFPFFSMKKGRNLIQSHQRFLNRTERKKSFMIWFLSNFCYIN